LCERVPRYSGDRYWLETLGGSATRLARGPPGDGPLPAHHRYFCACATASFAPQPELLPKRRAGPEPEPQPQPRPGDDRQPEPEPEPEPEIEPEPEPEQSEYTCGRESVLRRVGRVLDELNDS
jgi:hypothetical protein